MSKAIGGQQRGRLLGLFMAQQSTMHLGTVANLTVALPSMMADFHVDVATIIWVQLACSLALAGGTIPIGQLDALTGRRRLILLGTAADLLLMLVTVATGSIYVVIAARFLSALVRTAPWLYLQVMSVGSYPPEQRGRVLGLTRLVQGAAIVAGVPLAGWVVDYWGWRWLFIGTAALWAVLLVVMWRLVPADDPAPAKADAPAGLAGIDLLGGALLMAGAVGLVVALQTFARGQASALGVAAGVGGVAALVAFVWQERRARVPMLYLPLLGLRNVFVSAVQALFLGFVNGVVVLLLPFLFIRGYGWSAAFAGGVLLFLNLPRPVGGLVGGWLADRLGSARTIAPAALAIVVGQALAAALGVDPALPLLVVALLLMGSGEALASTANLRQIFSAMPRAHLALAPGTNLVLNLFGATLGQAFIAAALEVAGVASGSGGDPALVGIARVILLATAGCFLLGMVLAQLIPRVVPAVGRESLDAPAAKSSADEA